MDLPRDAAYFDRLAAFFAAEPAAPENFAMRGNPGPEQEKDNFPRRTDQVLKARGSEQRTRRHSD
jgi:hypothetical protein